MINIELRKKSKEKIEMNQLTRKKRFIQLLFHRKSLYVIFEKALVLRLALFPSLI